MCGNIGPYLRRQVKSPDAVRRYGGVIDMVLALVPSRCRVEVAALNIDAVLVAVRPHPKPIGDRDVGSLLGL